MFIRLSYTLNCDTPAYGGKDSFSSKPLNQIKNGDSANTSNWEFFNHLGTHIDFPYHFYQNGQTIEDFTDDYWIYTGDKIQVLDVDLDEKNLLIKPENVKIKLL